MLWNLDYEEFGFRESVGDGTVFDVKKFLSAKPGQSLRRSSASIERFVQSIFRVFYINYYKINLNDFLDNHSFLSYSPI